MGPSDKLQSNYGRYRRGKCQPRNCVDNWLTDCNKQCGGDRGNSCLILLISGYCLCRHFCFFHLPLGLPQIAEEAVGAMQADCTLCTAHLILHTLAQPHHRTVAHRNHRLRQKAKPHNMYWVCLQLFGMGLLGSLINSKGFFGCTPQLTRPK